MKSSLHSANTHPKILQKDNPGLPNIDNVLLKMLLPFCSFESIKHGNKSKLSPVLNSSG
jgi:hypothetical protein